MTDGLFPEDSAERKTFPVFSGLLQYFPSALAAIAHHSYLGNEKHNPGLPLHHDRAKSDDEADALVRHLIEGDYVGMAWRALSLLQKQCEVEGAPIAPAARNARLATVFNRKAPWEIPPPEYDPDDVAFRKATLDELAAELQTWGMYDTIDTSAEPVDESPDLRHIGIGDVPKAGTILPVACGAKITLDGRWDRRRDKTAPGTPADSAYLASFGPNVTDVRYSATNAAIPQHPMAAEVLRDHDERLAGPESHL